MVRGDLLAAMPEEPCLQGELNEALAEIGRLRNQLAKAEDNITVIHAYCKRRPVEEYIDLIHYRCSNYLCDKAQKEKVSG